MQLHSYCMESPEMGLAIVEYMLGTATMLETVGKGIAPNPVQS